MGNAAATSAGESWQGIRLSFRSHPRYLVPIRTIIQEATDLVGMAADDAQKVVLAVQEGCANVIRHCYKNQPDKRIDLILSFAEDRIKIRIDDYGEWVDPAGIKSRELDDVKPGGLGVHLMNTVMDHVEYKRNEWGGTSLIMVKHVGPPDTGVDADW